MPKIGISGLAAVLLVAGLPVTATATVKIAVLEAFKTCDAARVTKTSPVALAQGLTIKSMVVKKKGSEMMMIMTFKESPNDETENQQGLIKRKTGYDFVPYKIENGVTFEYDESGESNFLLCRKAVK